MSRMRRCCTLLAAVAVMLGTLGTGASAAHRTTHGATHARTSAASINPWCRFYDDMPMMGMSKLQMMDEMMFYPAPKHDLGPKECAVVVDDLTAARAYGMQFPTAADAMAAGYHMIAPYVPGQGAHYMGPQGYSTTFDPKVPNFLLYGGNGPTAPLVGLMWLVNSGQQPPNPGLPGGNDHWHRHFNVCLRNIIIAEEVTAAQCAAMGGTIINISNLWMLHAWILPGYEYLPDVFRPNVPFLM